MGRLDGKAAIITGAASGIGAATTRRFVAEGARVLAADVDDDRGRALVDGLDGRARYLHVDVSMEANIESAISTAMREFGRLDCMFNNAGIPGPGGTITEIAVHDWDRTVGILLRGTFLGVKHAAACMMERGSGSIISTASVAGLGANYGGYCYSAAKAGVIHLTRCASMELGERGVRINCIAPGGIATPIFRKAIGAPPEKERAALEFVNAALAIAQPIQRAGQPEDVAAAAVFLASDDSSFVTGQTIVVDGGITGGRRWTESQQMLAAFRTALDVPG